MAEKFPTPQERAMAWLLEATEIGGMSRPETGDRAIRLSGRFHGGARFVHRNRNTTRQGGNR